jgi:2'-5' RNA ligase
MRWVDQANYHITLAFLGDQEEQRLEQLAECLDDVLPDIPLSLNVTRLSPFPERRPKLIAALVERSSELLELQQVVISTLSSLMLQFDKKKFQPHITLGRYRHSKKRFSGLVESVSDLSGEAAEVAIFESVLSSAGAQYEALFRFPFDNFTYFE